MGLEIFISHAHADKSLVEQIILFLQAGVGIDSREIRATSHEPSALSGGSSINSSLRRDVDDCRCFLPVITEASKKSDYVKFEIGAAWALKKDIIPLISLEARRPRIPYLISGLRFINLKERDQVVGFGEQLGRSIFARGARTSAAQISAAAVALVGNISLR
jgi:TIR domain